MSATGQIATWAGLWGFWVFVSRNNHPTLLLNSLATGLMLTSFAAAIYANRLVLVPQLWRSRRFLAYWLCLTFTTCALTAFAVFSIQELYDVLWGPDPRRFSFWVNYGLDFMGLALHLSLAELLLLFLLRRRTSA